MTSKLELLCSLEGHSDRVWYAAVHPSRDLIATCGGDKSVRLWAPRRGGDRSSEWVCTAVMEDFTQRTVRSCAWSPDGRFLACASFDAMITVWALTSGGDMEMIATLEGHENEVKGVAWSPSGDLLATCSRDKSVWLWEYDEQDGEFECAAVLHGHSQDVKAVAWHPSRELLFSASYDDTIKAWGESPDEADWVCTDTLAGHGSTAWSLAFSPDGSRLATVGDDCNMIIWRGVQPAPSDVAAGVIDALSWRREATISGYHTRTIFSVSWSKPAPSRTAVAVASSDSANTADDRLSIDAGIPVTGAEEGGGADAAGRTFIASCGADDSIRIFTHDAQGARGSDAPSLSGNGSGTGGSWVQCGVLPKAHGFDVNCVTWHPRDPSILISCGDDCTVKLWRHTYTEL